MRTHTCGELTDKEIDKEVTLCGWLHSSRDHGGLIFIDLRDRYGITQIVFDPVQSKDVHKEAETWGREFVLKVTGKVRERPKGMQNKDIGTGQVEVLITKAEVLSKSATPKIDIADRTVAGEELRLKYRYLDLRRPTMLRNMKMRHATSQAVRSYLCQHNFMEIETPFFVKHTPGGARVFKVASRANPGKFWALPESPQMYKQLLMVAGMDRYFQIVKCFRDEDLRQDRQPEFTQIDIEMSFINQDQLLTLMEGMMAHIFKEVKGMTLKTPFQRMTWKEALDQYGSDKPDTRFEMKLQDVSEVVKKSDFSIFKTTLEKNGVVYAINVKDGAKLSRKQIDKLTDVAKESGLPGLGWLKLTKEFEGVIAKFMDGHVQEDLKKATDCHEGDLLLFSAGDFEVATTALGNVRLAVAKMLDLIPKDKYNFLWVLDFPAFEYSEEEQGWAARHHIFTRPTDETVDMCEKDPALVLSHAHDIVLNGVEVGGGSIRIHDRELQARVLKVIGLTMEQAEKRFDFLLEAFRYGAPPHGGIAIGYDRLVALLCGETDIREVITFPRTKAMESPLDNSPQDWEEKWLKEVHLKLR
ncbi:MAG: aspartate--tRNA ligase [Candidatus Woesearchaeota archaeon]|jgi:aspartyl-tRNA synthetase|nr:aspartate--tRNA ligase [Candidatus Woesearchaeota archaeon]MDP7180946.1 aspartate--tRNA ligase [Candidatus Woesearchaeota archaeon]MDP7198433.1 aspartate--tRNA ligase [Candidatus Woesearchaeota archaeon]MDP7467534.1 aspartate--tRNA ligase [Candidatus Woesearchaeota archaeon]MDP7646856.1 aspartate--tRNA ligase [Candidatus Woesearchaeota archaeon]